MTSARLADNHMHFWHLEELSTVLAEKFATQCFSGLELYSFKDNFKQLADTNDGVLFWREATLIQFLSLPGDVGPIIFQAASYLAAFPFDSMAPAILDFAALVKVVALLTGRYRKVLKNRQVDRLKLLFRAFATFERQQQPHGGGEGGDAVVYDSDDGSEDLSLAALDTLDAIDAYSAPSTMHARIPLENLKNLLIFLLAIAPLEETQSAAEFAGSFQDSKTAECLLRAFGPPDAHGINYRAFKTTIRHAMPYLFSEGLRNLFEHFVFSKNVTAAPAETKAREPLLQTPGEILTTELLAQLSLFISGDRLWRRVRPLYCGSVDGFSMGSFSTRVLKWNAPTILLVSGRLLPSKPSSASEKAFTNLLPPRKHRSSGRDGDRIVYGVFLEKPWRHSHKECFGDSNTILFQLEPVHRVFRASPVANEFAYFNREDGIGFGTQPQGFRNHHRPSPYFNLGPVGMVLDAALEFGVLQHVAEGGAFRGNKADGEWQDRFEVEELEVWGCGGETEAEAQRRAWQWEEREAMLRRGVNLGKDIEADRVSPPPMVGWISANASRRCWRWPGWWDIIGVAAVCDIPPAILHICCQGPVLEN
jgi:hypothetical protein